MTTACTTQCVVVVGQDLQPNPVATTLVTTFIASTRGNLNRADGNARLCLIVKFLCLITYKLQVDSMNTSDHENELEGHFYFQMLI